MSAPAQGAATVKAYKKTAGHEAAAVFAGNISCGLEGAVAHLLAWLEHELYLPGQLILHILQYPGGAKQHGRMRVVTAHMAAAVGGTERQSGLFHYGQAVRVCTQMKHVPQLVKVMFKHGIPPRNTKRYIIPKKQHIIDR